jgi:hypothetical protein
MVDLRKKGLPENANFLHYSPYRLAEIAAAVHEHNKKGDAGIHLIDMTPLKYGFGENSTATQFAPDGCHPTVFGNAMLGAFIAAKAQKFLSRPLY